MPGIDVIRFASLEPTPWLGGGGVTREIARGPAGPEDFGWRISIADVSEAARFSPLPGIDRVLTFCDGPRMVLTVDGHTEELTKWQPVSFSGDSAVFARVPDGPTRDLNVMTRRGVVEAQVEVKEVRSFESNVVPNSQLVVVVLDGGFDVMEGPIDPVESAKESLHIFDALVAASGSHVKLLGGGRLQVVRLTVARIERRRT